MPDVVATSRSAREDWDEGRHQITGTWPLRSDLGNRLLAKIGEWGEAARDLAYRLYQIYDRKRWAEGAFSYNPLVQSWPEITRVASQGSTAEAQTSTEF